MKYINKIIKTLSLMAIAAGTSFALAEDCVKRINEEYLKNEQLHTQPPYSLMTSCRDKVTVGTASNSIISTYDNDDIIRVGYLVGNKARTESPRARSFPMSLIDAGSGNDAISVGKARMSTIKAGSGDDVIKVRKASDTVIETGSGDDRVTFFDTGSSIIEESANNRFDLGIGEDELIIFADGDKYEVIESESAVIISSKISHGTVISVKNTEVITFIKSKNGQLIELTYEFEKDQHTTTSRR